MREFVEPNSVEHVSCSTYGFPICANLAPFVEPYLRSEFER